MEQGAAKVPGPRARTGIPGPRVLVAVLFLLLFWSPRPASADPRYTGPLLYGLDPVIGSTDDPRLLGVQRLVMLRRLESLGVRPGVGPGRHGKQRPTLASSLRRDWDRRANVDLVRTEHLVEYNGPRGLLVEITYPRFFFLFPRAETLPGGFVYYPPRPLSDPVVGLFVDDLDAGMRRRQAVDQSVARGENLGIAGRKGQGKDDTGLINLTIPIKLPRTLEKIIGRGEKTKIKISGREHISLSGESTVIKPFVANERVSKQSLFPSLDMQQELQVNLSGTIGEKIIIEVDHNSEAVGPEGTKIKLMYQGLEDEVIKTIESGDVGLTLPGSQLLGYSSNKSGLFGLKVTGQVGRADFTLVASKQKSESSSKTFNAKGGQVEDKVIYSSDYLNNRFFRLDRPEVEPLGRTFGQRIDLGSLKIYQMKGPGQFTEEDIENVAAYVDSLGAGAWGPGTMDFTLPHIYGQRWREITAYDPLLDSDGGLVAIDMRQQMLDEDVLAVTYNVLDQAGGVVLTVGDRPGTDAPAQALPGIDGVFYRLKLLKAPVNDNHPHIFNYVLRNIYSLGGANIDPTTFELRIERNTTGEAQPQLDEQGLDYIRIFGLDRQNPQGLGGPDGVVDSHDPYLFDLPKGLLKFPLDFPTPFAADSSQYAAYADTSVFRWEAKVFLFDKQAPQLYDPGVIPTEYSKYQYFRIVARHASASSYISLGVSNIEEGSESVTLDGRTLSAGTDYEIDYTFGEIKLLGEAANLTSDSQISVSYAYAPFLGGGKTSLMGLNLGYDLGRDSKMATTWLYQTEAIVGEKAKLGEEPSKTLVGNLNLTNTFKPYLLTHFANLLSRHDTELESSVQFSGEVAVSLPNPNTKGRVFLEDFEGVDSSDFISLTRIGWSWASAPFLGVGYVDTSGDFRDFDPEDRVKTVRWFLPQERVLRRYLNPDLINQERDDTQQSMDLYLRAEDGRWDPEDWGGIMRGVSRTGVDLSKSQFVEIWVNDGKPDLAQRTGRLHIDFGFINEDGFWPTATDGQLTVGDFELEDGIRTGVRDGVWTFDEDVGLDGDENGPQKYSAEFEIGGDSPFPQINGTSRNNREDTEDLNGNTRLDRDDGFFTATIDLRNTEALVDVVYDYDGVQELVDNGIAWRKYRIPIGSVDSVSVGTAANIKAITHARIWYENDAPDAPAEVQLQLSDFKFLGSRWEREGVRRIADESLLGEQERLGGEFFLGEVNNKENPDYHPPFIVNEINNIPEKEQSLVLNFKNLQQGHMIRASKQVSPRGDDYTRYRDLSWYFYNPSHATADLDLFFRVGSDTLNYYEVGYRFSDSPNKTGWQALVIGIAELSNVKYGEVDGNGNVHGTVQDQLTGQTYAVRVVGRPDLRNIKRYYFGIMNKSLSEEASGYFYFNDVRLEDVKKESGLAQRAGVRVNMADVLKVDLDWKHTDAEFHGLDKRAGSGIDYQDWNVASNFDADDFVPLLGFQLPINVSRRQTIQRPKYVTNSDIEIIEEDTRNLLSTVETQERFSTRLSHLPSQGAVPRYLVDPWTVLVNGSRSRSDGPLDSRRQKSLQGSLNYDLRINGRHTLAAYPILRGIPLLRGISVAPKKIAMGASFTSSWSTSATVDGAGNVLQRPEVVTRPAVLSASADYDPASILNLTVAVKSDRDLLREHMRFGTNIGQENRRSYDLRMTIVPPLAKDIPAGVVYSPLRTLAKGTAKLRPSIQFNGSFVDQHDPALRQADDPVGVRSISNNGNWDFRFDLPVGEFFSAVLPKASLGTGERERLIEEQRRREQQSQRGGGRQSGRPSDAGGPGMGDPGGDQVPGDQVPADQVPADQVPADQGGADLPPDQGGAQDGDGRQEQAGAGEDQMEGLTPEDRMRLQEERLLEDAQRRLEQEREEGPREAVPAGEGKGQGKLDPRRILDPMLSLLRSATPVKVTISEKKNSSYARLRDTADFWYMAGLTSTLDVPDSLFAAFSYQDRQDVSLSTTTKLGTNLGLDLKYANSLSSRDQVGSLTKSYKQDWPDVQVSLSSIEKWGVFGREGNDPSSGWFRSSTFNIGYKHSKTVNNYTDVAYNPNVSTTITPRWTFNFHSGMTATLTSSLSRDSALSNGVSTDTGKMRLGLQLRHQFRAQSLLAKLGLYKPGNTPTINMDVDISYQRDRTERINPGGRPTAPTGQTRYSANPRFSYQVTRNLNGAVRFIYSRSKNIATDQTTTSLGLGVEATFVF